MTPSRLALSLVALGALVAPAAAQAPGADSAAPPAASTSPVDPPATPCRINLIKVPAGMQAEIESWVAAEPRCRLALDVRVIQMADGLYVMATDASGRMRERTVPDATTAGVLIASWAADDGAPGAPAPAVVAAPAAPAEPAAAPPPMVETITPGIGGPGSAPVVSAPGAALDGGGVANAGLRDDDPIDADGIKHRLKRMLVMAGVTVYGDGLGARAHADVFTLAKRYKVGVMAAYRHSSDLSLIVHSLDDVVVGGYFAVDFTLGRRMMVRATGGFGATITQGDIMANTKGSTMIGPTVELTATVGYALTSRLELQLGAVVGMLQQDIATEEGTVAYERGIVPEGFVGLGYRR